jgi:hypothetical protein
MSTTHVRSKRQVLKIDVARVSATIDWSEKKRGLAGDE